MRNYDEILAIAAERHGGVAAVLADITPPKTADELAAIPDHEWLAQMARGIFPAGISWKVVDTKWPEIVAAFEGFDVGRVAMMSDDWFDALIKDPRIIRSPQKVRAIQENAVFIQDVSKEAGGFGRVIGDWPNEGFAGLLMWLKSEGARLGGATGGYMLRMMGRDGYILTGDVTARLIAEGVIDKPATSQKAMHAVQDAFNEWAAQSGRSLTEISRTLAKSITA